MLHELETLRKVSEARYVRFFQPPPPRMFLVDKATRGHLSGVSQKGAMRLKHR